MIKILRKRIFKSVVWFSLFVFLPFAFGIDAYAQARDLKEEAQSKKLSVIINSIKDKDFDEILSKAEEILEKDFSDDLKKDAFKTILSGLKEKDGEIRKQFKKTEAILKKKNLSPEILKRHKEFVEKYEKRFKQFEGKVNSYTNSNWLSRSFSRNGLKGFIKENTYKRETPEFDPNKLPHRSKPVKEIQTEEYKPPEKKELKKIEKQGAIPGEDGMELGHGQGNSLEGIGYSENIDTLNTIPNTLTDELFAYAGDISMLPLLVSQSGNEYLQETMEVQFTPEIDSLATLLEHDPVKIYEYVRNNFDFEPYYGSLKGAQETFYEKAGNDFDLASLLISLLRVSGIKSRYAYGEIIVPIDRAMGWLGVLEPRVTGHIFATGGFPSSMLIVNGEPYGIRIEHCWVEAYIPWIGDKVYLGAGEAENAEWKWVNLDPSYKQYEYVEGVNLSDSVTLDTEKLVSDLMASADIDTMGWSITGIDTTLMHQEINNYVSGVENLIGGDITEIAKMEEYIPKEKLIQKNYGILGGTLPFEDINILFKSEEIPLDKRHKITFKVKDKYGISTDFTYAEYTSNLIDKRITLSYVPSTQQDLDVILEYGEEAPAYLVNVTPELKIDGEIKASGSPLGLGEDQSFIMEFTSPGFTTDLVSNEITAGSFNVVCLDLQNIPYELIKKKKKEIVTINELIENEVQGFDYKDGVLGTFLNFLGLEYFYMLDRLNRTGLNTRRMTGIRFPSEAIVSYDLQVFYSFGVPNSVDFTGTSIDVDRDVLSSFPIDGKNIDEKQREYNTSSGILASLYEGLIFEKFSNAEGYSSEGMSAVKALLIANEEGIPIYNIDKTNISQILPLLQVSNEVKANISNSVNAGLVVSVPAEEIECQDWKGIGYIIYDPETGSGAYIISGGISGGVSVWREFWELMLPWIALLTQALPGALQIISPFATLAEICMYSPEWYEWLLLGPLWVLQFGLAVLAWAFLILSPDPLTKWAGFYLCFLFSNVFCFFINLYLEQNPQDPEGEGPPEGENP